MGTDIDIYKLAGGTGKPYIIKGEVTHPGGAFKVVFTSKVDNAKFSAVKIYDESGNKVAWAFAEDIEEMLKQPGAPPVVSGPVVWKDATQPMEIRVADLVKRMTLREKIWQMRNAAPAIERLGLPGYNYWSEGLHGVARKGIATVFPQAIGMAASFNPELMQQVGDAISTEARAKYYEEQKSSLDGSSGLNAGLTFWSPNINIFRDPRWGRGQETYGEDPLLTGRMAVAFIRGMQGDDPKYLKVVATAKHFAVHSGPESLRHVFDADPPVRDFYETYLPQFEMAVREGQVYSVMGAYNRVYGSPACSNELLLKDLLRKQWGFKGYVVSDCWAINDIWANHHVAANEAEAGAEAVLAGCDLECGSNYGALDAAVDMNLIGEGAVNAAVSRVLLSRFKLGLFDPPAMVKWASIRPEENDSPVHQNLALKMARESIVLLKNDGVLPLDRSKLKTVAVVGPNSDGLLGLLGNYNGTPARPVTVVEGIREALKGSGAEVIQVRGCDSAEWSGIWQLVPDVCLRPSAGSGETGLQAHYFASDNCTGNPIAERIDKTVDFRGEIDNAVPVLGAQSVVWTGEFVAPADGDYQLGAIGGNPNKFLINGVEVPAGTAKLVRLRAGQTASLQLASGAAGGALSYHLLWNRGDVDVTRKVTDRVKNADVIIFAGGLDGHIEAEESDQRAVYKGFPGGDRDSIELPDPQTALIKALVATGKPVIFVDMTGSAVALPSEADDATRSGHLAAIIQAWYPGEEGGQAIADVLFGDYNPSGKLPVTFYKASSDLPAFTDYAMSAGERPGGTFSKGRTYRYFVGVPQWPFGHGLSYTDFQYGNLTLTKATAESGDSITVSVNVTNMGGRDGDDVVEFFARPAEPGPGDALQRLINFKRVSVAAGETLRVDIAMPMASLRYWDDMKSEYSVKAGRYSVEVGRSATDVRASKELVVK